MLFCGKKRENGVGGGGASNTKKVAKPESKVIIDEDGAETIEMKCTPDQSQDAYSNSQIAANHNLARDLQTSVNIVDEKEQENLSTVRNSSPFSSTTAIGVVTPTPLAKISEHSAVTTCNETSTHKGLSNHVGENNCFLNVAIQTLWHLGPFRYEMQKLISSKNKASNGSSSELDTDVMEALCNLFVQYEHAKLSTIPSTELRKILSGLFDECRLGGIADANETLEAILERIHQECTPMCPHGSHKCLAHTVFGGLLLEQATCRSCGASSEPKIRNDFMHYVYAAELIALNEKQSHRPGPDMLRSRFGSLLHECMEVSFRSCPSQDRNHFKGRVFTSGATSPNTPNGGRSGAMTPNPMYGKFTDKDVLMAMDEFSCREDHLILTDTTSALHSPAQSPIQSRKPSIVTPAEIECNCAAEVRIKAVEPPNVLAISVAWTSAKQSVGTLRSFLSLISNTIQLADLFDINDKVASSNTSACNSPSRKSSLAASLSNALASASRRASVNSPGRKSSVTSPSRKSSVTSPGRKDSVNSPGRKSSVNSPTRGKKVFPLGDAATGPSYTFRGFVCYYGSHYVSIFQDRSLPGNAKYLLFDDQTVRQLGEWDEVKRECLRSVYQPVLLLYELENSEAEIFHNGTQTKAKKEFVEKHVGNKKPRERSPLEERPQYCATEMMRPGGPKMISQVIRSRSPSPKSWIIQEPDAGITLDLPSANSSQKNLTSSLSTKSVHERPNSMKGYSLSEIFTSPSCESTNTIEDIETIRNPLISNHKEGRLHNKNNSTIQPIEIYKRRLLVSRVTLRLKRGEQDPNSPKTPPKGIIRSLFDEPEKNILGIIHGVNRKGHVVVMGFAKHPVKGRKYAAENSGKIFLDDRLLSVENLSLHKLKKDDVKAIVHGFLQEKWRDSITLEVESSTRTAVWYICPYCGKDNKISEEEVAALTAIREQIIADHDSIALKARLLEECLTQPHENRIKTQNENNCGKEHIMEYHFSRKLLCVCSNCQFPSSASNLFHLKLFV